jgi:hypothetical protein
VYKTVAAKITASKATTRPTQILRRTQRSAVAAVRMCAIAPQSSPNLGNFFASQAFLDRGRNGAAVDVAHVKTIKSGLESQNLANHCRPPENSHSKQSRPTMEIKS